MMKSTVCVWVTADDTVVGSSSIFGRAQKSLANQGARAGTSTFKKTAYHFHKELWSIALEVQKRRSTCHQAWTNTWRSLIAPKGAPLGPKLPSLDLSKFIEEDDWGDFVSASPSQDEEWAATLSPAAAATASATSAATAASSPPTQHAAITGGTHRGSATAPTTTPTTPSTPTRHRPTSSAVYQSLSRQDEVGPAAPTSTRLPSTNSDRYRGRLSSNVASRQNRLREELLRAAGCPNIDKDVAVCTVTISFGAKSMIEYVQSLIAAGRSRQAHDQQQQQQMGAQKLQPQVQQQQQQQLQRPWQQGQRDQQQHQPYRPTYHQLQQHQPLLLRRTAPLQPSRPPHQLTQHTAQRQLPLRPPQQLPPRPPWPQQAAPPPQPAERPLTATSVAQQQPLVVVTPLSPNVVARSPNAGQVAERRRATDPGCSLSIHGSCAAAPLHVSQDDSATISISGTACKTTPPPNAKTVQVVADSVALAAAAEAPVIASTLLPTAPAARISVRTTASSKAATVFACLPPGPRPCGSRSLKRLPSQAREIEGDKLQEGVRREELRREDRLVALQAGLSGPWGW